MAYHVLFLSNQRKYVREQAYATPGTTEANRAQPMNEAEKRRRTSAEADL